MPPAVLEIIGASARLDSLPIDVTQKFSPVSTIARLMLLLPALLLVLVPAASLLGSAPAMAYAAAHPGDAVLAAGGVIAFLILFGLPFGRALHSLATWRRVRIEAGCVMVEDCGLLGRRTWTLPLSAYTGIAHVVRTSLSGTRHELVLVHPVRVHRVLLCTADRLTEADLAGAGRLLRLPLLPAGHLYRWSAGAAALPPASSVQAVAHAA